MHNAVKLTSVDWAQVFRLIPSHFPPINLFEHVADPEELELVFAIEALTNDRLREQAGNLANVPPEQRISGPGTTPVMAAFTHVGWASRFTDGRYGVYYGANTLNTAIAETIHHREQFLRATSEPDTEITMRCYVNQVTVPLHDIREPAFNSLLQADYASSQQFARDLREQGSNGLVYPSVRDPAGECVALFKPKAMTIPIQQGHYKYIWSGKRQQIETVLEVSLVKQVV